MRRAARECVLVSIWCVAAPVPESERGGVPVDPQYAKNSPTGCFFLFSRTGVACLIGEMRHTGAVYLPTELNQYTLLYDRNALAAWHISFRQTTA